MSAADAEFSIDVVQMYFDPGFDQAEPMRWLYWKSITSQIRNLWLAD
jgi:hypothetical protein